MPEPITPEPIRVLVVDDSAFMRKMVTEILSGDPALRVVGQARDGADALRKWESLRPQVVTLDIEMPVMDGCATLAEIMRLRPTPVIMLSSLTQAGADITLRCLDLGAVDFVGKPSGAISLDIVQIGKELIAKVKVAAQVRFSALSVGLPSESRHGETVVRRRKSGAERGAGVLVIGASTGGPRALQELVPGLTPALGLPVVIVQHMPPGFTGTLARRLNSLSPFIIREAAEGDSLEPGVAWVAPGGFHLQFDANKQAHLSEEPPVHGIRPAVDVTLASLLSLYGAQTMAVLLTGMGRDGARGLKTLYDLGGETFAEAESTCVVYGMPRAAVALGAVCHLLPLPQLAAAIMRAATG